MQMSLDKLTSCPNVLSSGISKHGGVPPSLRPRNRVWDTFYYRRTPVPAWTHLHIWWGGESGKRSFFFTAWIQDFSNSGWGTCSTPQIMWLRVSRKAQLDLSGDLPSFLESTSHIRRDLNWRVLPVPPRLQRRHVDIGDMAPCDTQRFIKALQSPAQGIQVCASLRDS